MRIFVTGGAGFIGSAVARRIVQRTPHRVVGYDKLTYAGNLDSLVAIAENPRFAFVRGDICDRSAVDAARAAHRPHWIMNLAAESHVGRLIDGPAGFIRTDVVGTGLVLEAALAYWRGADDDVRDAFRFHHISTDEVFGSLGAEGAFREDSAYAPNSRYSASKAGSDHFVRARRHTFGLPTVQTNCSNNYGPLPLPGEAIPLTILNALEGKPLPVYGRGDNVRDWLHVEDHAEALLTVVERGRPEKATTSAAGPNGAIWRSCRGACKYRLPS